jgi:hypothetical protein
MVPASSITITSNGEHLACSGFSLSEPVHLGNFEFIADYFGGLSQSPGGATKVPFLWAQLASGHLLRSGPQPRTPWRSSSLHQARKEATTTHPPDGVAWGPRLPPLQQQHGRRMLQPRQDFSHGEWWRSQKPTTPPIGITLTMMDNRRKPVLDIPLPSLDRCHDKATSSSSRPLPRFSQTHYLSASLCSRWRGSFRWTSPPLRPRARSWLL